MNVITRGIRNAFRNVTRTVSLVLILGLSIGLALSMLIAHQAVNQKISSVKSSIGNTITIAPAGFSGFSSVNNALTTTELAKAAAVPNVTSLNESLTDRLTTIGSSTPSFPGSSSTTSSNASTSLTSPVKLNTGGGGGGHFFFSGGAGQSASGSGLPANFSLPITITGANEPSSLGGTTLTITSGSTLNGTSNGNDAMISKSMASKNNLQVGSTFTAYGTTMTVTGIFTVSGDEAAAGTVVVSLPTEQRLSGQSDDVTSAIATVNSLDNLNSATNAIKNTLGSSADVTSAQTAADNTVQPLNSVKTISLYSVIGAVIAGAVIILLTMIMIVRERRREIGVIKAIGASNGKVVTQFATEAVTLTVLGAFVGMILGVVAGNPITKLLVNNSSSSTSPGVSGASTAFAGRGGGGRFVGGGRGALGVFHNSLTNIHTAVGWSIILYGLGAAIIIALIGSTVVSFFIAKIRPAVVMRVE